MRSGNENPGKRTGILVSCGGEAEGDSGGGEGRTADGQVKKSMLSKNFAWSLSVLGFHVPVRLKGFNRRSDKVQQRRPPRRPGDETCMAKEVRATAEGRSGAEQKKELSDDRLLLVCKRWSVNVLEMDDWEGLLTLGPLKRLVKIEDDD